MVSPLASVEWGTCLLEQAQDPELEAFVRKERGLPTPSYRYLYQVPWIVRAMVNLAYYQGKLFNLDLNLADLVAMEVSRDNSCRYCYAAHRLFFRLQGLSEQRVSELEAQLVSPNLEPRITAAIKFARRMSQCQPMLGGEDSQRLREAGFSDEEQNDLSYVVSYMLFTNRISTILALPVVEYEETGNTLSFKILRPIIRKIIMRHHHSASGQVPSLPYSGPWDRLVNSFAGSPIQRVLGETMEAAWSSSHLSPQAKLLMWAIVAKSLGCQMSLEEARNQAASHSLPEDAIDRAIQSLHAPELNETENILLGFSRQTVWYQPAPLQRMARDVLQKTGEKTFLDAVGFLALCNAMCRLSAAMLIAR